MREKSKLREEKAILKERLIENGLSAGCGEIYVQDRRKETKKTKEEKKMSKIISKTLMFDAPEVMTDVAAFNVFFSKDALTYDSPSVNIPAVSGQEEYAVTIPGPGIIITEGTYNIGVAAVDAAGNQSDIEQISFPFDLTAPPKPENLRVS
jgi:hypothetical protein